MEKCAVLMSTYNGEKYVTDQINSILSQKNVEIELFIRDDGSNDCTVALIEDRMNKSKCIHLYKGDNLGVTSSFKELAEIVDGLDLQIDYYAFADQDDIWLDEKICSAINLLKKYANNQPLLYYSNLRVVDEKLKYKFERFGKHYVKNTKKSMLAEINVLGCTCVFNKCLLRLFSAAKFENNIPHDAWIALQGMFLGKCIYDNSAYILYRQHGNNESGQVKKGKNKVKDYFNKLKIVKKMKGDYEQYAQNFLDNYSDILDKADKRMFESLVQYRSNIFIKIRLFLPFYINSGHIDKEIARRIRIIKGVL